MSEEFTVDPLVLHRAVPRWADQAARLASARARLLDASTTGFPAEVAARVGTWTQSWGSLVGDLADRTRDVADQLDAAFDGYTGADWDAREQFQTWLREAR